MATSDYWKYWDTGTSSDWTTTSDTGKCCNRATWVIRTEKRYLVECPESWSEKIIAGFVALINDKTNTGFKVLMVIRGEIRITDPEIDCRTMENFVPLLRQHACKQDWTKIEKFFKTNGDK